MPTVKCRLGRVAASSSKIGLIIDGVISLDDRPYRPPMTRGIVANGGVVTVHRLGKRSDDREIQGFADRAWLLRPVEDRDRPNARRQGGDDLLGGKRLEQADPEHADPLARGDECVDGLLDRSAGRAHHDDHPFGVGGAVVVDQPVSAARPGRRARP